MARPRLTARIAAALEAGSVALVAEPGSGKTTALEHALGAGVAAPVWIDCTDAEREPAALLQRIADAVRAAGHGAADSAPAEPRFADRVAAADVGSALVADLERILDRPIVIVLDQLEAVQESEPATAVVTSLLAASSERARIAVVTRHARGLKTSKLRTAGQLTELGPSELAFSASECGELLGARLGREATSDEVEVLLRATEGWALAVSLATAHEPERGGLTGRGRVEAFAFLGEEVLDRLDDKTRDAALRLSLPREFSAEVARALGVTAARLKDIGGRGLFLRPAGRRWFRYHPLFREFLLERLEESANGELRRLHAQVAPALSASDRGAEAVEHWLAAEDWPRAVEQMTKEGTALAQRSPRLVRRWLERLPDSAFDEPALRLLEGELEWLAGRYEQAIEPLRAAVAGYRWLGDAGGEWTARYFLADVLHSTGEFEELVELASDFEDDDSQGPAAPNVVMLAAVALAALGRAEESERTAERALARGGAGLVHLEAVRSAYLDVPAGRLDDAVARLRASAQELLRSDPLNRRTIGLAALGHVLAVRGDADSALDRWRKAVEESESEGRSPYPATLSRIQCALIEAQAGRMNEAQLELARAPDLEGLGWRSYTGEIVNATLAAMRGEVAHAVAAADRGSRIVAVAPVAHRVAAATALVPVLVEAGQPTRARDLLEDTLAASEATFPGASGRFYRALLLAQRAWLSSAEGREREWEADFCAAWEEAGPCVQHVLRREWARLEPLLWSALERGLLEEPERVLRALARARPGGEELLPFISHPDPRVRRAAVAPAVGSGHPKALVRLRELEDDPDEQVVAAARAAAERARQSPAPLVFRMLGRFETRRGIWLVDDAVWGRPMAARLVRFLLVNREALVPEDVLFQTFWPEKATVAARRNLQVALSRARYVVDAPGEENSMIEAVERGYRIRLREQDIVDTDEFEIAADAALAERGPGRLRLLRHAEGLWSGEPLPEDRYAAWSAAWRERLVDRYIEVLGALVEMHRNGGDTFSTIETARKLVRFDPVNEAAHRELMTAYARSGRKGPALRQYLECRRTLVDELGIEPSESTSRLQARLLAGEEI